MQWDLFLKLKLRYNFFRSVDRWSSVSKDQGILLRTDLLLRWVSDIELSLNGKNSSSCLILLDLISEAWLGGTFFLSLYWWVYICCLMVMYCLANIFRSITLGVIPLLVPCPFRKHGTALIILLVFVSCVLRLTLVTGWMLGIWSNLCEVS